jgi:hypothetical protein
MVCLSPLAALAGAQMTQMIQMIHKNSATVRRMGQAERALPLSWLANQTDGNESDSIRPNQTYKPQPESETVGHECGCVVVSY